ncbi:DUF4157 domain-containing protein [Streptomyces sp. NPDC086549]|uniref:eCIS core domain-containing protein n=1 Tax=Streptomyces sp. NPDC086549 TaxID=3365752 RepID=UPI0037F2873E
MAPRSTTAKPAPTTALPAIVRDAVSCAGQPLETGLRPVMEGAFNHDFSAVRVHSDHRAATALGANAFSIGEHIVLGPGIGPDNRRVIAHELAHVVQHRLGAETAPGVGPAAGPLEDESAAAAAHILAGRTVAIRPHTLVQTVLLDRHEFGAGQVRVVIDSQAVTVNGTAIPAALGEDGRLRFHGREIVLDRSGVFRYRDRYTVCRPCNPDYYEGPRGLKRPASSLPEALHSFYDTPSRTWVPRTEPQVTTGVLSGEPIAAPGPVNPVLQQRVQVAQAAREQFEARVERAMADGNRTRAEAEQLVRQRMQDNVDKHGLGQFESGQTYALAEKEIGPGVRKRTATRAVGGGTAGEGAVAVRLPEVEARLAKINHILGENFGATDQALQHAEVRAIVRTPDAQVYYSFRDMCPMCRRYFLLEAAAQKRIITVVDPTSTLVFTPDFRIVEYRPTEVYEHTALITRANGTSQLTIGEHPSATYRVRPVPRTGPTPLVDPQPAAATTTHPSSGGPVVTVEGAAAPSPRRVVDAPQTETGGSTGRAVLPETPEVRTGGVRPGARLPEPLGERPVGVRPRGVGGARRFALGAAGALAEGAFAIVMMLVDVIMQLVVLPYLERLQRQLDEEHRARLQEEIQRYYETHLTHEVENLVLAAAERIRRIEDRDAQPCANISVTVHFERSWNLLFGQGSGPPESIRDLSFVRLDNVKVDIDDTPVEDRSEPLVAEDTNFLTGDHFSKRFSQTIHFSATPPSYQDLVDRYGPNPASRSTQCFIATACYGTPGAPQVAALRRFRDAHLMTRDRGRSFVKWYYRTSPPIARTLRRHPLARRVVRWCFVTPLVTAIVYCRLDRHPDAVGPLDAPTGD